MQCPQPCTGIEGQSIAGAWESSICWGDYTLPLLDNAAKYGRVSPEQSVLPIQHWAGLGVTRCLLTNYRSYGEAVTILKVVPLATSYSRAVKAATIYLRDNAALNSVVGWQHCSPHHRMLHNVNPTGNINRCLLDFAGLRENSTFFLMETKSQTEVFVQVFCLNIK